MERYFTGTRVTVMDGGSLDICQFARVRRVILRNNIWEREQGLEEGFTELLRRPKIPV